MGWGACETPFYIFSSPIQEHLTTALMLTCFKKVGYFAENKYGGVSGGFNFGQGQVPLLIVLVILIHYAIFPKIGYTEAGMTRKYNYA